tara:strand:- start:1244 stop:1756 length:513 start_codon:yes stop_codon:yes gene_type:complete
MTTDKKLQAAIDAFTASITELIHETAMERIQDVLAGASLTRQAPSRAKTPGRKKTVRKSASSTRKSSGKRVRRTEADLKATGEELRVYIQANPGCAMSDMSAALGQDPVKLRPALQLILASKKVKTTGQKRGTKYFAAGASSGVSKPTRPKRKAKAKRKKATARKSSKKK